MLGVKKSFSVALILFFGSLARANIIGSDAQNFNPTTNGLDFVTVESSETLHPGVFNVGLFLNNAVNTLPYFPASAGDPNPQSRSNFNDYFLQSDVNMGIGLANNWDIGFSFPSLLDQEVDNTNNLGVYSEGITEIRVNTKYRLWGTDSHGVAISGVVNFNQIKNNPYAGKGAGPTYNLQLVGDTTIRRFALGANIGYRWRTPGDPIADIQISPLPNQFIASVAASYLLSRIDTKIIFEVFSSFPDGKVDNFSDRELSAAEALLGVKHDWTKALALHAGAGTEIAQGTSSPDWRLYAGLNWNFGPLWGHDDEQVRVLENEVSEALDEVDTDYTEPYAEDWVAEVDEPKPDKTIVLPDFYFKFGTGFLVPESRRKLQNVVKIIKETPQIRTMIVEGHTDSVGPDHVNLELSQFRAKVVKTYLQKRVRLKPQQIKAVGYGEQRPIADNGNYQGRAKNRRVEIKLFFK